MKISLALIMSESTITALIVGVCSIVAAILGSITTIVVARRGQERIIERVVQGNAEVAELKKNTDGMHTALMDLSARANLAEGQIQGAATERDRPALITEPDKVTEALNGSDVRKQIDKIEAAVSATQDTLAEEPAVRPAIRKQIDKIETAVEDKENQKG